MKFTWSYNFFFKEPVLFDGSLRSNMDPLGCYQDKEILESLKKVLKYWIIEEKNMYI